MIYKLTKTEYEVLKRLDTAMSVAKIQAKAVEDKIGSYVLQTILPKAGIKRTEGMATPIEIRLDKKIIEIGIERPDRGGIIVPAGTKKKNGEIETGKN